MTHFQSSRDVTWTLSEVYLWSEIEIAVAVVCACLPTLHPILRVWMNRLTGSKNSRSYGSSSFKQLSKGKAPAPEQKYHFRPENDESVLTSNSAPVPMDILHKDDGSELEINEDSMGITVRRNFEIREDPA